MHFPLTVELRTALMGSRPVRTVCSEPIAPKNALPTFTDRRLSEKRCPLMRHFCTHHRIYEIIIHQHAKFVKRIFRCRALFFSLFPAGGGEQRDSFSPTHRICQEVFVLVRFLIYSPACGGGIRKIILFRTALCSSVQRPARIIIVNCQLYIVSCLELVCQP